MVASTCSASVTVPDPSSSLLPNSRFRTRNRSTAPGTVIVTSITVIPPASSASTSAWPSRSDRARSTGIIPTRSIHFFVSSKLIRTPARSLRLFCLTASSLTVYRYRLRATGYRLSCDPGRSTLHHALHFGKRRHARIAGSRHRQCPMRRAATHRPLYRLARENPVDQPRRERVAAAYAIQNLNLRLRHERNLAFRQGHRAPRIARRRVRRPQRRRNYFEIGVRRRHVPQHLL